MSSIPKNHVNSWLEKQALWQVSVLQPKERKHPHYKVTKTNRQDQFDLFYVPHKSTYQQLRILNEYTRY